MTEEEKWLLEETVNNLDNDYIPEEILSAMKSALDEIARLRGLRTCVKCKTGSGSHDVDEYYKD